MAKKKEKATESKKTTEATKVVEKPESRGTGHTNTKLPGTKVNKVEGLNKKLIASGVVAVVIGAIALVGLTTQNSSTDLAETVTSAPAAAVVEQQPARATSEAAAASLIPQPLAPQKTQLAEPAKPTHEIAKPMKENKKAKMVQKTKAKDSKKMKVASKTKVKPAKVDKKSKKTLAAKSQD